MAMTEEERRSKQSEYNRQYYLAHRDRKLKQNARSARTWRTRHPDKYKLSQERCREKAREVRGLVTRPSRVRECEICHQLRSHKARGMCTVCYGRWRWQNRSAVAASIPVSVPTSTLVPQAS